MCGEEKRLLRFTSPHPADGFQPNALYTGIGTGPYEGSYRTPELHARGRDRLRRTVWCKQHTRDGHPVRTFRDSPAALYTPPDPEQAYGKQGKDGIMLKMSAVPAMSIASFHPGRQIIARKKQEEQEAVYRSLAQMVRAPGS